MIGKKGGCRSACVVIGARSTDDSVSCFARGGSPTDPRRLLPVNPFWYESGSGDDASACLSCFFREPFMFRICELSISKETRCQKVTNDKGNQQNISTPPARACFLGGGEPDVPRHDFDEDIVCIRASQKAEGTLHARELLSLPPLSFSPLPLWCSKVTLLLQRSGI